MKTLAPSIQVIEVPGEGFDALLGQTITVFCAVYIYTGKLVGNNADFIKLESPKIVYETGSFNTKEWKDAQALPNDFYIQKSFIESFGILK
jgi:hypothetical protein